MRRRLIFGSFFFAASAVALFIACSSSDDSSNGPSSADGGDGSVGDESTNGEGGGALDSGPPPTPIQVSAGLDSACVLLSNKTVWCWGDNTFGEVGADIALPSSPPLQVSGIANVDSISVGTHSACAIEHNHTVWCWGRDAEGELVDGSTDRTCGAVKCNPVPVEVGGILALQVAVGENMACAIEATDSSTSGPVICWGINNAGQAGIDASTKTNPKIVVGINDAVQIKFGYDSLSVCALEVTGQVSCWGRNDRGQLGHTPGNDGDKLSPDAGFYNNAPQLITVDGNGGAAFDQVVDVLSSPTMCAVKMDGTAWCWGRNDGNGVTGGPDSNPHPAPTQIATIANAHIVTGGEAVCVLDNVGATWCWGADRIAQAGAAQFDGGCFSSFDAAAPCYGVAKIPAPEFSGLSVYGQLAVGICVDGGVFAWGRNNAGGRLGHPAHTLGDDDAGYNPTPLQVPGIP